MARAMGSGSTWPPEAPSGAIERAPPPSFAPCGAWLAVGGRIVPWLAPWATLLRFFGAESARRFANAFCVRSFHPTSEQCRTPNVGTRNPPFHSRQLPVVPVGRRFACPTLHSIGTAVVGWDKRSAGPPGVSSWRDERPVELEGRPGVRFCSSDVGLFRSRVSGGRS